MVLTVSVPVPPPQPETYRNRTIKGRINKPFKDFWLNERYKYSYLERLLNYKLPVNLTKSTSNKFEKYFLTSKIHITIDTECLKNVVSVKKL